MDSVSRDEINGRPRPMRRSWLGLALSTAVHIAAVPLIGTAWLTHDVAPPDPPVMEVTLAWAPPASADDTRAASPAAPPAAAEAPTPAPSADAPPPSADASPVLPTDAPPPPPPTPAPPQVKEKPHPRAHAIPEAHKVKHSTRQTVAKTEPAATPVTAGSDTPTAAVPATASAAGAAAPAPLVAASTPPPDKAGALSRYSRILLAQLERHKTYPALSLRRGEEGTVTVRLTLFEDGRLAGVQSLSEGPDRLVEASLAAVQAAAPFPPLPPELGSGKIVFDLPITYRLR